MLYVPSYQLTDKISPYVVQAFEAYANGKTVKEIVEMLNAKGVTTSQGTKITINSAA